MLQRVASSMDSDGHCNDQVDTMSSVQRSTLTTIKHVSVRLCPAETQGLVLQRALVQETCVESVGMGIHILLTRTRVRWHLLQFCGRSTEVPQRKSDSILAREKC
jgi:hypothetical protein